MTLILLSYASTGYEAFQISFGFEIKHPPVFENMQVDFVLNPLLGTKRKPKRAR